jgi:ATP-dependent Clp protease ATP-binding subunit ClpA
MHNRFTDRARKVMQLANQEALRFYHEYIGTEHILLGLVQEGSGVAANVLKNLDIDLRKIRLEVEKIVQHGPGGEQVVMGRLPHTPRAQKVLDYSVEEARNLNHNYVGTEHLLLGLLCEQEGVAAQVLMNLGLNLEAVHKEVVNLLGPSTLPRAPFAQDRKSPAKDTEIVQIPKRLTPGETETYGVSDFTPDEAAAAPQPATPQPPPGPLTAEQLAGIQEQIRQLTEQKEAAVMEQDFEAAAKYRLREVALRSLLAWYEWARGTTE